MTRACSPLRYPGGKACLTPLISQIIEGNGLKGCHYVEPYAGGCGLALALLFTDQVSEIWINDIDESIWSFWKSVLDHTDELIGLIESTDITVDEWRAQREIQREADKSDPLKLGFATFFLNRTNRSGIISGAGMIGGYAQAGKYKMDCRFNKQNLIRRIGKIQKHRSQIHLSNRDAVEFMRNPPTLPESTLFCIDPPYFNKGSRLYTSFYNEGDHADVARAVMALNHRWLVTYDDTEEIREYYDDCRQYTFDINYSIQTKRVGTELMVASSRLALPDEFAERQINAA